MRYFFAALSESVLRARGGGGDGGRGARGAGRLAGQAKCATVCHGKPHTNDWHPPKLSRVVTGLGGQPEQVLSRILHEHMTGGGVKAI